MPPQDIISVIYVVGNLRTGGPTMQLLYLISNLDRTRFKPIVIVTSASGEPTQIERRLERAGVEVIRIEAGKLASMFRAPLCLRRVARREARVVLHPYGFRSDIICWLSRVRPRLGNVRNHTKQNCLQSFGRVKGTLVAGIYLHLMRRAITVVACSASVKEDLSKSRVPSVLIRNAIDPELYSSMMGHEKIKKSKKNDAPTYITVASSIPGKNIEFLLEHFSKCYKNRRLVVIGSAAPSLIEEYGKNANIEFCGRVEKPASAYLAADYFISASLHEGMPNAVLESLALGRPVVLSRIPAHQEVMRSTNLNIGGLFDWNTESLENALVEIEGTDYLLLSDNCHIMARLEFSARKMARAYQEVYSDAHSATEDNILNYGRSTCQ